MVKRKMIGYKMNMGFQISEEDIINVLNSHQVTLSDSIDNIMSIL